jgi:hypothetical protein
MVAGKCHITVPPQTGLEGIDFANIGTGSGRQVKVTSHLEGIKYSLFSCGKDGTFTNGTYEGTTVISGT